MIASHPYLCDVCGKDRSSDANHWWLLWVVTLNDGWRKRIEIQSWHDGLARERGIHHVCGQECLVKKSAELVAEVARTEIAPKGAADGLQAS